MANLATLPTVQAEIVENAIALPQEAIEPECCFTSDYEVVTDWLLGKSRHTQRTYYGVLNQFSVFLCGEKFGMLNRDILSQISKKDIQAFLYSYRKKGNKPSTIKSKLAALNSLFKHLVAENYRSHNPAQNIKLEKENKEDKSKQQLDVKQKTITPNNIQSIVQSAVNERDRLLFELIYSLGLRRHEALNLCWSDFYFVGDQVWVHILGKGNKPR
jgi:site-specific recombinase XerD